MSQDHLEDRLVALLQGQDLELPARADATGVVQKGVTRARRQRRAVQGAVPAVLAVAAIAIGLTAFPDREEDAFPSSDPSVLTGSGIGEISLGMTVGDAQAAGLIGELESGGNQSTCRVFAGTGVVNSVSVRGSVIVRIDVDAFADTPEGLHIGSTWGEVQSAYDDVTGPLAGSPPTGRVDLTDPGSTRYTFNLDPGDADEMTPAQEAAQITPRSRIISLALVSTSTRCCAGQPATPSHTVTCTASSSSLSAPSPIRSQAIRPSEVCRQNWSPGKTSSEG